MGSLAVTGWNLLLVDFFRNPLSHPYQTVQKHFAELTPRWPVVGDTASRA